MIFKSNFYNVYHRRVKEDVTSPDKSALVNTRTATLLVHEKYIFIGVYFHGAITVCLLYFFQIRIVLPQFWENWNCIKK